MDATAVAARRRSAGRRGIEFSGTKRIDPGFPGRRDVGRPRWGCATRSWGSSLGDPVVLALVEERAVADLEDLRRGRTVPPGLLEGSSDERFLDESDRLLDRQLTGGQRRGAEVRWGLERVREVRDDELVVFGQDDGALDRVLELA